jgi:hypothetical protein
MPNGESIIPDNLVSQPDPNVVATSGSGNEGDPAAAPAPAQAGQTVEQLQAELQQTRKSYDELRSFNDRRFNELQDRLAKTEATAQTVKPVVDEEFEKRWETEINENPGKNVKAFVRGVAQDMLAEVDRRVADRMKAVDSRLMEVDPEIRARKADIDRMQSEYGVSREVAAKIVLKELRPVGPATPPNSPAPGRMTAERGRVDSAPHVETVTFGEGESAMLRYLGLDAKKMAESLGRQAGRG